jgi:hypothetical protein
MAKRSQDTLIRLTSIVALAGWAVAAAKPAVAQALLLTPVRANTLSANPGATLVVIADAPIFLTQNDKGVPFVIAKRGSRLDLILESEDWYNVQFLDQFGRRVGYIQSQYVRDAALAAPAAAAQRAEVVRVRVLTVSERVPDQESLRDLTRDLQKRKKVLAVVDSPERAELIVEFRTAAEGVRAKLTVGDYSTELGSSQKALSNLHHLGDAIERWIKDNATLLLKRRSDTVAAAAKPD